MELKKIIILALELIIIVFAIWLSYGISTGHIMISAIGNIPR